MLFDLGYPVVQAGSGALASEMMRTGLRPDLLITDYAMPSMTGVELARNVRSRAPHMPVLLITGYANLSDDEAARLPQLAKPFRQADLAAAIAELLQGDVIRFQRPSSGALLVPQQNGPILGGFGSRQISGGETSVSIYR